MVSRWISDVRYAYVTHAHVPALSSLRLIRTKPACDCQSCKGQATYCTSSDENLSAKILQHCQSCLPLSVGQLPARMVHVAADHSDVCAVVHRMPMAAGRHGTTAWTQGRLCSKGCAARQGRGEQHAVQHAKSRASSGSPGVHRGTHRIRHCMNDPAGTTGRAV